jgi:hypothetical protein
MDDLVPSYLHPPADRLIYRSSLDKEEVVNSVHIDLGLRWYHTAAPAREAARLLTAKTGEMHLVVANDYGTMRCENGVRAARQVALCAGQSCTWCSLQQ